MYARTALIALALLVTGAAYAEKPDLTGAVLVHAGVCRLSGEAAPCAVYEKSGVRYLVLRDEDEEQQVITTIYRVLEGATIPYRATDFELLWSKDQEERAWV